MGVPIDVRDLVRSEKLTVPNGRRSTVHAAASTAAYLGFLGLALALSSTIVWLGFWGLASLLLAGHFQAVHEAVHGNLYQRRFFNDLAGVLWGVPVLNAFATYRSYHYQHHAYTSTTGDTEPLELPRSRLGVAGTALGSGIGLNAILWWDLVRVIAGHPPRYARRNARRALSILNALGFICFIGGVRFLAGSWSMALAVWGVPALGGAAIYGLSVRPEHHGCAQHTDSVFATTRTVLSNRWLSTLFWNAGLHTAHHLTPTVTGPNLPRVQSLIDSRCVFVEQSYTSFYKALFKDPLQWEPRAEELGSVEPPAKVKRSARDIAQLAGHRDVPRLR